MQAAMVRVKTGLCKQARASDIALPKWSNVCSKTVLYMYMLQMYLQGILVGFKGEMIHVYNKNESAIHKSDYFEKLKNRENIILMGDSIGDLKMADGATNAQNLLKIGFLNDKVNIHLQCTCTCIHVHTM